MKKYPTVLSDKAEIECSPQSQSVWGVCMFLCVKTSGNRQCKELVSLYLAYTPLPMCICICARTGVVWKRASCTALFGIVHMRGWILGARFAAETRWFFFCGMLFLDIHAVKLKKSESRQNHRTCVISLPAAFIPHGLWRDMCAPVCVISGSKISPLSHANISYHLTRKMWQFSIRKTGSVKREEAKPKRGTWYVSGINTARRWTSLIFTDSMVLL